MYIYIYVYICVYVYIYIILLVLKKMIVIGTGQLAIWGDRLFLWKAAKSSEAVSF